MKLTREDQEWLEAYRQALEERFPDLVEQLIIYGSKARGTATPESDLDILVILQEGDWKLKDRVAALGDELALGTEVVPSILVYNHDEWNRRRREEAPFWRTVTRDAVVVQ